MENDDQFAYNEDNQMYLLSNEAYISGRVLAVAAVAAACLVALGAYAYFYFQSRIND